MRLRTIYKFGPRLFQCDAKKVLTSDICDRRLDIRFLLLARHPRRDCLCSALRLVRDALGFIQLRSFRRGSNAMGQVLPMNVFHSLPLNSIGRSPKILFSSLRTSGFSTLGRPSRKRLLASWSRLQRPQSSRPDSGRYLTSAVSYAQLAQRMKSLKAARKYGYERIEKTVQGEKEKRQVIRPWVLRLALNRWSCRDGN